MQKIKKYGLSTGISYVPVLPFLSDSEEEIDKMIKMAKDYGADFILVGALTLFGNRNTDCKTLYYKFLEKYHPELVLKYKMLYRLSFEPSKEYQKELKRKARRLCDKYNIKSSIV